MQAHQKHKNHWPKTYKIIHHQMQTTCKMQAKCHKCWSASLQVKKYLHHNCMLKSAWNENEPSYLHACCVEFMVWTIYPSMFFFPLFTPIWHQFLLYWIYQLNVRLFGDVCQIFHSFSSLNPTPAKFICLHSKVERPQFNIQSTTDA